MEGAVIFKESCPQFKRAAWENNYFFSSATLYITASVVRSVEATE
jgi:hypothetical protein